MVSFDNKTKAEVERLIDIGKRYCESKISESLLVDVLQSLRNDNEKMAAVRDFLAK